MNGGISFAVAVVISRNGRVAVCAERESEERKIFRAQDKLLSGRRSLELAQLDAQQAKIVEMRHFGGMTASEISEALEISERSVGREWQEARLWLYRELKK